MPVKEKYQNSVVYGNEQFSPREWEVTYFPEQSPFNPNIYKGKITLSSGVKEHHIKVWDEQVLYVSPDRKTIRLRQYLAGHWSFLRTSLSHQGWQGNETIRELYMITQTFGDGTERVVTQEIDLHKGDLSSSFRRWGKPDVSKYS